MGEVGAIAPINLNNFMNSAKKEILKIKQDLTELVANVLGFLLNRMVSLRGICCRKFAPIVYIELFMMRVVVFAPVDLKTLCRPCGVPLNLADQLCSAA